MQYSKGSVLLSYVLLSESNMFYSSLCYVLQFIFDWWQCSQSYSVVINDRMFVLFNFLTSNLGVGYVLPWLGSQDLTRILERQSSNSSLMSSTAPYLS